MKVFVINMAKDVRRKKDMLSQFKKLNLEVEFFEGVNGKLIDTDHFSQIANIPKLEEKEKRSIDELKGMVGCTYSHFLIYQRMINEEIELACILEDDVILADTFSEYIDYIEENIKSNEIISLHTLLYDPIELQSENRKYKECEILSPKPPQIRGTQGYVITKYCANQLSKEMMPIKEFPDCFNRYHLFCDDVQIRVLFPFIIRHMWIDSVRDDGRYSIKKKILKFIQKHRIFLLWNFMRKRRRSINDQYITSFISIKSDPINKLYVSDLVRNSLWSKL